MNASPGIQPVVIVTGGTRGIGRAIANHFMEQGASVIATGTNELEITKRNEDAPEGLRYIHADFSHTGSLKAFCQYIETLPKLDVLINNAGINIIKHVDAVTEADFDKLTTINYKSPYMIAQAAARVMARQRAGKIINIGSIWSVITKKGRSQYIAAKAGLAGMSRALATDLAEYNILVNCVSPGFVLTDLTRQTLSEADFQELARQIPLGRFANPEEIAHLVGFLGSAKNTYLTGQNIVIDGGFTHV